MVGDDLSAFTELVRRYQGMAFGYAFSILGDFHLAQDATQDAFVAAYFGLPGLRDPARFPGWLRGIVRHQCSRILRKRRYDVVSLDQAEHVAARAAGPDQRVEELDALESVLAAMRTLPEPLREVTILYYVREYSQREIAEFLELPGTTVNNRLHAARQRLKGGLLAMAQDALNQNGLPDDFAERVGRIVRAQGPVVDVQFASDTLPPLLNALTVTDQAQQADVTVTAAQHPGDGVVRGIVVSPEQGAAQQVRSGMEVVNTESLISRPVGRDTVQAVVTLLGRPAVSSATQLVETGIKIIELLCPYPRGGKIGVFGDPGVGKLVLLGELVHNVTDRASNLTVFAFIRTEFEVAHVRNTGGQMAFPSSEAVQAVYIPVDDPRALATTEVAATLDATTCLTRDEAAQRLWPAVDPHLSTSRCLDPAIVGQEHYEVATGVRQLLRRYRELRESLATTGPDSLSPEDRAIVARARRVRNFLSQPLFVAAEHAQQPGQFVSRAETVNGCAALLRGEYDHLPEEAFLHSGTLDQVIGKANATKG